MRSNLFELPDVVLKSFSLSGAHPHVVLTLSNDAYYHCDIVAKQLSASLHKQIVRIPQYITEYSIDEYVSSRAGSVVHLPFFAQRSKQLVSRLLRITRSLGQALVIGAELNDVNELKNIANCVDVIISDTEFSLESIDNDAIARILARIASSNVERNVELLRRLDASAGEIFSNVILGQFLLRGIEMSFQREVLQDEEENVAKQESSASNLDEKVYDELNVLLAKFAQKRRAEVHRATLSGSRQGSLKQRSATHGRPNRALVRNSRSGMFSLFNTLLTAAPHQKARTVTSPSSDLAYLIQKEDIRRYPYKSTPAHLEILILDSSGSMAGNERIRYAKGLIRSFVKHSYRIRSYCSLIVARSHEAKVVVSPTRRSFPLLEELKRTPTGGRTPLYDSLAKAIDTAKAFKKKEPSAYISISLLTDGKNNSDSISPDELVRSLNKERIMRRVFDTAKTSSSVVFAENIGATHHVIERMSAR